MENKEMKKEVRIIYSLNSENNEKKEAIISVILKNENDKRKALMIIQFPNGEYDYSEAVERIRENEKNETEINAVFYLKCEKKLFRLIEKHYPDDYVYYHGIEVENENE